MKPYKMTLALLALLPIFLIAPAAEAELKLAILKVKGMTCSS